MKRKLAISFVLALVMIVSVATPVLAGGGEDVNVEISEIAVDPPMPPYYFGTEVTASGTVTTTAEAEACGWISYAEAGSTAEYSVENPEGTIVSSGSNTEYESDYGFLWWCAEAEAGQVYSWSSTFPLDMLGEWTITNSGSAYAEWWYWKWFRCRYGEDSASAETSLVITAVPVPIPMVLTIKLPSDMAYVYVVYNANGTAEDVDFNDGTWRFQLPAHTLVWKNSGGVALKINVDDTGTIISDIYFTRGEPTITRL